MGKFIDYYFKIFLAVQRKGFIVFFRCSIFQFGLEIKCQITIWIFSSRYGCRFKCFTSLKYFHSDEVAGPFWFFCFYRCY